MNYIMRLLVPLQQIAKRFFHVVLRKKQAKARLDSEIDSNIILNSTPETQKVESSELQELSSAGEWASRLFSSSSKLAGQRLNAQENSPLGKLPTELLQQIANGLPVASAASLSLSCWHIYRLIGTWCLENLEASSHETLAFLKLIEHDLPDQIACNSCRRLHRIKNAKKYTEDGRRVSPREVPDCLLDDREARLTSYICKNFSTTVCKMALKHCNLFAHDSRTSQLLNQLSEKSNTSAWGNMGRQREAEFQIKDGTLFAYKRVAFHGTCSGIERDWLSFEICPHLDLNSERRFAGFQIITFSESLETWSVLLHGEKSINGRKTSWNSCSELQQCRYCRTEFKAKFEHDVGCKSKITLSGKILGKALNPRNGKRIFPLVAGAHLGNEFISIAER